MNVQDFQRHKKRMFVSMFVMPAIVIFAFLFEEVTNLQKDNAVHVAVDFVLGCIAFLACIMMVYSSFRHITWRCPKCGNFFHGFVQEWPSKFCRGCGISLSEIAALEGREGFIQESQTQND